MACLASLISNGAALLFAVGTNTCLLSPSVIERGSDKAEHPSYGDSAEDPSKGEPGARIGHRYLTGFGPPSGSVAELQAQPTWEPYAGANPQDGTTAQRPLISA